MSKYGRSSKKARFINPPNLLKQKVGTGGIDPELIEKSQKYIDTVELDFAPYARQFLNQLAKAVDKIKTDPDNTDMDVLVGPVMQLKANGGMFRYQLVSDVADIALQFLEALEKPNDDAFKVIEAHENTIEVIIKSDLKGDGGKEGYALVKELDGVCKRYFKKHKPKED